MTGTFKHRNRFDGDRQISNEMWRAKDVLSHLQTSSRALRRTSKSIRCFEQAAIATIYHSSCSWVHDTSSLPPFDSARYDMFAHQCKAIPKCDHDLTSTPSATDFQNQRQTSAPKKQGLLEEWSTVRTHGCIYGGVTTSHTSPLMNNLPAEP